MAKYKCRFCGREMIATALSYQSNQYCNHCFNERADSTQKQNLNTFEFMGDIIELEDLTPQEKANELYNKYRNYIISFLSDTMKDKNAKTASLIAVEEIINALRNINEIDETIFWLDVKQEIEKL
jgi:hypothetical protein